MCITLLASQHAVAAQEARCDVFRVTFYSSQAFPGRTADGTPTIGNEWGIVAVDPRIIPLGSSVYVHEMGTFRAADTGGGVHGNHIDVLVYTQAEAFALGMQYRTVCVW